MQIFRRLLGSKYGGVFAGGFLALIAFTFVAGDLSNFSVGGQSAGEAAKVGNKSLTVAELQNRAQMVFERQRKENPELTIDQFLAQGALTRITEEMISSRALLAYGEKNGMRISKALIDAQIAGNPAFADATGNFSETTFRQMLAQQRIPEKELRDDIASQIIQQHLLTPVGVGARAPSSMVPPYAAMLIEQRVGEMFAIPSATFAPKTAATDAELQTFFNQNANLFNIPEQRRLRYALVNLSRFEAQAVPTEAEIADLYKSRAAQYSARQTRNVSQLILTTEAAAKDAAAKTKQGMSLAQVASSLGLSATKMDDVDQSRLSKQTSADLAKAAFAAARGDVIGPVRASLGWAVLHVEDVREVPGKTLAQAREELVPEIKLTKERQLFSDFLSQIDGKLGGGMSLTDLAKEQKLTLVETPLLIRSGRVVKDPNFQPDEALTALLEAGFTASPDEDPQVVQVKPDEVAAVLAVAEVTPAGPPPFAEVKAAVQTAWSINKGSEKARAVATQLTAELSNGAAPGPLLTKLGIADAPHQSLSARRTDLQQQNGRIPPPLEALFALKTGAARMVPLENNQGFIVVRLDEIKANDPNQVPQLMQSTASGLSNVLGNEYAQQFLISIQQSLGVTRNEKAIAQVEQELRRAYGAAE